jgi:hypothetical protein
MRGRTRLLLVNSLLIALACAYPPPAPLHPATSCAAVPPDSSDTTVYDSTNVTEKAVIRSPGPVPTYPPELQVALVEGDVLFAVVISQSGVAEPSSVHAIRATAIEFVQSAKTNALGRRYWPACFHGRPVRYRTTMPFEFSISGARYLPRRPNQR